MRPQIQLAHQMRDTFGARPPPHAGDPRPHRPFIDQLRPLGGTLPTTIRNFALDPRDHTVVIGSADGSSFRLTRVSTDGKISCAACHNPSLGYMAFTARAAAFAVDELTRGNL